MSLATTFLSNQPRAALPGSSSRGLTAIPVIAYQRWDRLPRRADRPTQVLRRGLPTPLTMY